MDYFYFGLYHTCGLLLLFLFEFFFLPLSDLKVNSPRYSIEQQQQQEIERKEQVKALANKNFETTFSPLLTLHTPAATTHLSPWS